MTRQAEPLGSLKPGTKGRVTEIGAASAMSPEESRMVTERLRELGFMEGIEIEVMGESPFGRDPLSVRIDKTLVALRRREARGIMVEIDRD